MTTIYLKPGTVLPDRRAYDFYPTPRPFVEAVLQHVTFPAVPKVLDPGAGEGVWGQVLKAYYPKAHVTGVELRDIPPAKDYDQWIQADFLSLNPEPLYHLVIGNPPYKIANQVVKRGLEFLRPDGQMVLLLRLAYLEGVHRGKTLYQQNPPFKVLVSSKRISFYGNGKTNTIAYAIFHWIKGYQGGTTLSWFDYATN